MTTPNVTMYGTDGFECYLRPVGQACPKYYPYPQGTTGAGGSQWADVITFHGYLGPGSPPPVENILSLVGTVRQIMTNTGNSAKPLFDTEASWNGDNNSSASDRIAFLSRFYLLHASLGVQRMYWYAYDNGTYGTLWNGSLLSTGVAYQQNVPSG